jgi:hypothetical protein
VWNLFANKAIQLLLLGASVVCFGYNVQTVGNRPKSFALEKINFVQNFSGGQYIHCIVGHSSGFFCFVEPFLSFSYPFQDYRKARMKMGTDF